jgi:hypothetical protein
MTDIPMKENDIFRWHWKPGSSWDYHCRSNIAVFVNGGLRDTFWYDWKTRSWLEPEAVDLEFLGNIDECETITPWRIPYYRPADIIDMRHSNDGRAPIYLKRSASKDQAMMLEHAEEKERQAYCDKDRAERAIAEWEDKIRRIKEGDLEVSL